MIHHYSPRSGSEAAITKTIDAAARVDVNPVTMTQKPPATLKPRDSND